MLPCAKPKRIYLLSAYGLRYKYRANLRRLSIYRSVPGLTERVASVSARLLSPSFASVMTGDLAAFAIGHGYTLVLCGVNPRCEVANVVVM